MKGQQCYPELRLFEYKSWWTFLRWHWFRFLLSVSGISASYVKTKNLMREINVKIYRMYNIIVIKLYIDLTYKDCKTVLYYVLRFYDIIKWCSF